MADAYPLEVADLARTALTADGISIDDVLPEVYDQLRRIARSKLRAERSNHTLDTSALDVTQTVERILQVLVSRA